MSLSLSVSPMAMALDVARLQNGINLGNSCGSRDPSPMGPYVKKQRQCLADQNPHWTQELERHGHRKFALNLIALLDCLPLKSNFNFTHLKQSLRKMLRSYTVGAVDSAISLLVVHQEESLLLAIFRAWKYCLAERRHLKEIESQQLKEIERKGIVQKNRHIVLGRSVQMLERRHAKHALLKAFPAWKDAWVLAHREKSVLKAADLEKQWKKEASFKAIATLTGGQETLLIQSIYALWKEVWTESCMERIKIEHGQKIALKMFGSSEKVCMQGALMAWRDECIHAAKHRDLERLKQEMEDEKKSLQIQMESERKKMKAHSAQKTALALFGAKDEVLIMSLFKAWAEEWKIAKQAREVAALQKEMDGMKVGIADSAKKVALKMLAQDATTWLKTGFQAWRDMMLEERQLRLVEKLRISMEKAEDKAQEGMQRAAQRLFGTQEAVFLRNVYTTWKEIWTEASQQRLIDKFQSDMRKSARNQHFHYQQKAAAGLIGSQTTALSQSVFSMWKEDMLEEKRARAVEEMHRQVSHAKIEAAQRTALRMFGSQEGALLQAIWSSWREVFSESQRQHAIDRMQDEMRQMKSTNAQKAAISLFQAQGDMLIQSVVSAWYKIILNIKQEHEVQRLKDDMQHVRAMGEANARRAAMRLLANDAEAWYKTGFQSWRDLWLEERQRREVIKLQNLVANTESKQQEFMKQAATRLFGSQEGIFIRTVVGSWRDICLEIRQNREADQMIARMNEMKNQHKQKLAQNMIGGQTTLLFQTTFNAWRDSRLEAIQQRKMELMERELSQQKMHAAQRTALNMFGSQLGVLKQAAFSGWKDTWTEAKMHNEVRLLQDQMRQEMRQMQLQGAHQTMMSLIGSQTEMLFRTAFSSWRDVWIESKTLHKSEAMSKMLDQMKEDQKNSAQQVAMRLLASDASTWMKTTFTTWRDLWQEGRTAREIEAMRAAMERAEAKATESIHRAGLRLFGNQEGVLLRTVNSAWRDIWIESKQIRQADMLRDQMMYSMKQQSREYSTRAAHNLAGKADLMLQREILSEWKVIILAAIREREMEALRAQISATKMESAHRVAMNMFGSNQSGLTQFAFSGWKDLWLEERRQQEKLILENEVKQVKIGSAQKTALALFGAQEDLLVNSIFTCWRDVWIEEKTQRATLQMQRELESMREKSTNNAYRSAQRLLASTDEMWVRTCFSAWREFWSVTVQEKAWEMLQREIRLKDAKVEENMRQAAMKLFGSQDDVLVRVIFAEWGNMWREGQQAREVEEIRQEMATSMRRRSIEASHKAAASLAGSQDSLLLQSVFRTWTVHMSEVYKGKQQLNMGHERALKLMATSVLSLTQACCLAWREAWQEGKKEREVIKMYKEMRLKSTKSVSAVIESQSNSINSTVFRAWDTYVKQIRWDRELRVLQQNLERMKVQSYQNAHRAANRIFTGTSEIAFHTTFAAWKELFMAHRQNDYMGSLHAEMSQSKLKSAYQTALSFMSNLGNVLVKGVFAAWRDHWTKARHDHAKLRHQMELVAAQKQSVHRSTATMLDMQARMMTSVICRLWKDWVVIDQGKQEVYGLQQDVLKLREDLQSCAVKLLEGPEVELPRFVALMVAFSDMCCLIMEGIL